jgi:hypothetical protein
MGRSGNSRLNHATNKGMHKVFCLQYGFRQVTVSSDKKLKQVAIIGKTHKQTQACWHNDTSPATCTIGGSVRFPQE